MEFQRQGGLVAVRAARDEAERFRLKVLFASTGVLHETSLSSLGW
jgi:hypothetical protein